MAQKNEKSKPGFIDAEKKLTLHTRQALSIFYGRREDPENDVKEIRSVQMYASQIKTIWLDAVDGNPFARLWIHKLEAGLKSTMKDIDELKGYADEITKPYEGSINLADSEAVSPVSVTINYASPYSYQIIFLLINIDMTLARLITLKHMGLLTPKDFDNKREWIMSSFNSCLNSINGYKSFKGITDADVKNNTGDTAEAVNVMGKLPEFITSGKYIPELMPTKSRAKIMGFRRSKASEKPGSDKSPKSKEISKKGTQDDSSTE